MTSTHKALLVFVTAFSFASLARADIPPPMTCMGTAGMTCNNAGPSANQPGICTNETCSKALPGPDGGLMTVQEACVLCEPVGSSSDAGNDGGKDSGGGGCAMAAGTSTTPLATPVGSLLVWIVRRKRNVRP